MKHRFKVTLERLSEIPQDVSHGDVLQFKVENHDDIFRLVDRMRTQEYFPRDSIEAFVVGLKLFSEVMLENRDHPLFAGFAPHFKAFMNELKNGKSR